jgi:uncharacterized damage-inducible protein DinB
MTEELPAYRAQVNAQFAEAVTRSKIQQKAFSQMQEKKTQELDAKRTALKARVVKIIEGLEEREIDNWITQLDAANDKPNNLHAVLVLSFGRKK